MARRRRLHLFVRRTTPACRIHRRKQRKRKPVSPRTPPLYRYRGDETSAPRRLRRDEAKSYRRHQIKSDHPKHVRQPRQFEGVKCRKLAQHTTATKTGAPTILPTSPTEYEGMDPARHLYQPKLHSKLDTSSKLFHGPTCLQQPTSPHGPQPH